MSGEIDSYILKFNINKLVNGNRNIEKALNFIVGVR